MKRKTLFRHVYGLLIFYLTYWIGWIIYYKSNYWIWDFQLWVISFAIFGVVTIIYLVIFIKYWKTSKDTFVSLDHFNNSLNFKDKLGNLKKTYSLKEIRRIDRFCSFPVAENRGEWFPWDCFNYSKVTLSNGEILLLTSFMLAEDELSLLISSNDYQIHKVFYAFPW